MCGYFHGIRLETGENMINFAARLKIFLLCALMFVAACGIHSPDSSRSSNSGSATPASTEANPVDAMSASIKAQLDAKSYRARMQSHMEGKDFRTTVEYGVPAGFLLCT